MKLLQLLRKLLDKLSLSDKAVHYLCGTEALPHPLSPEEESELLDRIAEGDSEAKDKLV